MAERADADAAFSYDLIAEIYDDDMGRNVGDEDVAFYAQRCAGAGGPVLELGCGTGRITLPLVRAGNTVTGLDL
ncbi:MAG TPA: class I SAM-dependent methyltransferase, partial [Candidatus Limnocylindrales bacterium]|nr:class I SAM-dependent methyltransferase [Candidatus Limnocylindrales bacterium]